MDCYWSCRATSDTRPSGDQSILPSEKVILLDGCLCGTSGPSWWFRATTALLCRVGFCRVSSFITLSRRCFCMKGGVLLSEAASEFGLQVTDLLVGFLHGLVADSLAFAFVELGVDVLEVDVLGVLCLFGHGFEVSGGEGAGVVGDSSEGGFDDRLGLQVLGIGNKFSHLLYYAITSSKSILHKKKSVNKKGLFFPLKI